jgi:hypothetical protein
MSPEITLIKKRDATQLMSKRVYVDEQGSVRSDASQCLMARGTATRAAAATASDLATLITSCGSDQAIALGSLKAGLPDSVAIATERKLNEIPGAIARTRDFIDYVPGSPGWALIDFDTKGMPPSVVAAINAAGGMWNVLLTVAPGLNGRLAYHGPAQARDCTALTQASSSWGVAARITMCWSKTQARSSASCGTCMTGAGSRGSGGM